MYEVRLSIVQYVIECINTSFSPHQNPSTNKNGIKGAEFEVELSIFHHLYMLLLIIFHKLIRNYLDKTISLHLNKARKVSGTLRGYDQFMNIVLGDAIDETKGAENQSLGMVVSKFYQFGLYAMMSLKWMLIIGHTRK